MCSNKYKKKKEAEERKKERRLAELQPAIPGKLCSKNEKKKEKKINVIRRKIKAANHVSYKEKLESTMAG